MKSVQVVGRFVNEDNRNPIQGSIDFVPSRIWVDHDGETYPTMEHHEVLSNGCFLAYLTRTDTGEVPWHYSVKCPAGEFEIEITGDGPYTLKQLMGNRYV